jgi:hypothetical protein
MIRSIEYVGGVGLQLSNHIELKTFDGVVGTSASVIKR